MSPRQQKELLFFSGISLLFVYPIIHANFYFQDDLLRVLYGYTGWEDLGRPLATVVQLLLSAAKPYMLIDVAPLTQISAALLLALSAFQFNEYLKREYHKGLIIAAALIIVNPFFLFNLSYRYDSFSMALGLFLAVQAFCLPLRTRFGSKSSIVLLIASLSVYQSDINIFIALVAIEVLIVGDQSNLRGVFSRLYTRTVQFCTAYILYFITVGQLFIGDRGSNRSSIVEFSIDGLATVFNNIGSFFHYCASFFTPVNALFLSILVLLVLWDFDQILKRSENKKTKIVVLLLAVSLYFVSLFGPLALLSDANIGYRVIPSFYMFVPLLIIVSSMAREQFSYVWLIALALPIIVSFQYGVAVDNQRKYEDRVSALIQYDLLHHRLDDKPIYIKGGFNIAPHSRLIFEHQPFLANFASPRSGWTAAGYFHGLGMDSVQFVWPNNNESNASIGDHGLCTNAYEEVVNNSLYSVYTSTDNTFVLLSIKKSDFCQ
ncbi:MAG: hypothetical protein ACI9H8_000280 [Lysobacterales bacterium]